MGRWGAAIGCLYCIFVVLGALSADEIPGDIRVAIVGEGAGVRREPSEPDWEVLGQIFHQMKTEKPRAVFYTGNLISGLEQNTSAESSQKLRQILVKFSELAKIHLGGEIPVYAVMGNHTFVNSQAVAIFRQHFGIENAAPLEPYQLAYDTYLDGVQFVVLATGIYERKYQGYRDYAATMPLLDWLAKTLRTAPREIRYRFVMGHEPAYSSGYAEGKFFGLDRDMERRDLFWRILREEKARAYFCSHEAIYDRSNRDGVWQVISGGASQFSDPGAKEVKVFPHHILLRVPGKGDGNPVVTVIDLAGAVWDEFELLPSDRPVHQFRISMGSDPSQR